MERLVLSYIRDGVETRFPVKDLDHAINLADNIAESDLLNDGIGFNCFELYTETELSPGVISRDVWESECCDTFEDVWRQKRGWESDE